MQGADMEARNTSVAINYKGIAREKLLGRYSTIIGAILMMQLILFFVSYITDRVVDDTTAVGMIIYVAILVITGLISAVFTVGELTIYMKLACGDGISSWDIFSGFKGHPDKAIILQFYIALKCLVYMIPGVVLAIVLYMMGGIEFAGGNIGFGSNISDTGCLVVFLLSVIALIAGMIGAIYVRICYSQCFYLLLDSPDLEPKEILAKGREMMEHHKWSYFIINLSFIPIILLGILSLGVGLMYIQPYRGMTLTEFYLALASGKLSRGKNIDILVKD